MSGTYLRILEEIEKAEFRVFDGVMKLSTFTKILIAFRELFAGPTWNAAKS